MVQRNKLIVVYGPTACGKTALAVDLAKSRNGEVISADSRQIYRGLDIGTGKATAEEMDGIRHHMLDIVDPSEQYSVAEFKRVTDELIADIWSRGKTPILCGGTGLYVDAVIYDFGIPVRTDDPEFKKELEAFRKEHGNEALWKRLEASDPEYAKEIHPNSYPYVMRALEVWHVTGRSKRDFRQEKKLRYETEFVTPFDGDREKLYGKIDRRVEKMFEDGLVEEVRGLLGKGFQKTDPGLESIGYKEVIQYLEWGITLEEAKSRMRQGNRNYAKRQITWFRKYSAN